MLETTCTNCGREVRITPDAEFCAACGENLKALIPRYHMSEYFYSRASALAETASNRAALQEVQRGLEQVDSAELQLLAAILAETEGEYDLMRQYVSRIPVSDRLRDEGEWLLRSHQARKSAKRLGSRHVDYGRFGSSRGDSGPADSANRTLTEPESPSVRMPLIGQGAYDTQVVGPTREIMVLPQKPVNMLDPNRRSRRSWPGLLTVLLLLGVVWIGWRFLNGGFGGQQAAVEGETVPIEAAGEVQPDTIELQATPTPEQAPAQEDAPRNNVTDVVVDNLESAQPVVAAGADAVDAGVSQPYDLNQLLLNQGRSDLAAFRLDATVKDKVLTISGEIDSTTQREEVIALARTAPELFTVSATDLLVRQPDRYTIEPGDNLWFVAEKLYGNGERWREIYEANQDVLSSPEAIIVGQTLRIPQDN